MIDRRRLRRPDGVFTSPPCSRVLTAAERALLRALADGYTYSDIALAESRSYSTVKVQFAGIRAKLGALTLDHAIGIAFRAGLIS